MKIKLDKEEQELLDSFERGEWKSVPNLAREKKKYQKIARATLQRHAKISLCKAKRG
jgi:hypothetical protein